MADLHAKGSAAAGGNGSHDETNGNGHAAAGIGSRAEMTLHQLRIFWAVAHAETLTKAAKQLGLTQPSLSQQLSKLETTVGARLFDRTPGAMALTDAGSFLLRKAEYILSNVSEATDGLRQFSDGMRATIRVAGLNSVLRVLLPPAMARLADTFPGIEFDIHETAPADALELLYGRRVNVGLVAENSIASSSVGFKAVPVASDPYVFAVPESIDLDGVTDPDGELDPAVARVLNSCIQFTFGTQHTRRVEQWYQQVLPRHRLIAQCRSYEVALGMVQAGLGVCLVPALTAFDGHKLVGGVRLYRSAEPDRSLVALLPGQYIRAEPYRSFLKALEEAGKAIDLKGILDTPPFLHRADRMD
ncbi:MAG: LysR family transcriptional regulator [Bauldia sp.]|nr:LysR family transcriptional regulator [Bauldia sp.]MCW5718375.1 LysR family transcriptional regulator [Bauldia sp.]